jgi:hypothetical protein
MKDGEKAEKYARKNLKNISPKPSENILLTRRDLKIKLLLWKKKLKTCS